MVLSLLTYQVLIDVHICRQSNSNNTINVDTRNVSMHQPSIPTIRLITRNTYIRYTQTRGSRKERDGRENQAYINCLRGVGR
jgi:hypothetical protein